MFATLDKIQSAISGHTMTSEVAQIRKGERLMKEAEKIEIAQNNTL